MILPDSRQVRSTYPLYGAVVNFPRLAPDERGMTETRRPVCAVIGAGEGLGAAIARAFSREGLAVCPDPPSAPHTPRG